MSRSLRDKMWVESCSKETPAKIPSWVLETMPPPIAVNEVVDNEAVAVGVKHEPVETEATLQPGRESEPVDGSRYHVPEA